MVYPDPRSAFYILSEYLWVMAGLYIHIPYCKQACHYCNFHFSTNLSHKGDLVDAMIEEMQQRSDFLSSEPLTTIYLGGGTPSLLNSAELARLFKTVEKTFPLQLEEVTLEANPDDITQEKLRAWRDETPIDRLSLGVQSFAESDLQLMNRAHNTEQAHQAIQMIQEAGFTNFNMDLIFGLPGQTMAMWRKNLEQFLEYGIPHLSAYSLTVEPNTALFHQVKKGSIQLPVEETIAEQFLLAHDLLTEAGYRHYEISNYALPGHEAVHNTSYWQGKKYLGIGPGAHSYNGTSRLWNVANNLKYLKSIQRGVLPLEEEKLTNTDLFNEWLMTGLRTTKGIDLETARMRFGSDTAQLIQAAALPYLETGQIAQSENILTLTRTGMLMADAIIADLFLEKVGEDAGHSPKPTNL